MTGKTQEEAVTMLRKVPAGGVVRLVVSRLDDAAGAGTSPQSAYTVCSYINPTLTLLFLPFLA